MALHWRCLLLSVLALLSGCFYAEHPVSVREARRSQSHSVWHVVKKGETLYAIAWQHEGDYRQLARFNRLKSPYALKIGQKIRLKAPRKLPHRANNRHKPKRIPRRTTTTRQQPAVQIHRVTQVRWSWPTVGKVINQFAKPRSSKGIDIAGRHGQTIRAAASGKVAYAGQGIRGYGKLLILKHNDLYLSAYAHNRQLLVKEGSWVKKGQIIAKMGRSGRRALLHFEIRRMGKPVNPLHYLPKR